jgi:hypothetical protein
MTLDENKQNSPLIPDNARVGTTSCLSSACAAIPDRDQVLCDTNSETVEHLSTIATPASYMDGAIVSTGTYARPMGGVPPQFVDL